MAKTKRKTRPAATKEDKEVLIYIYALLIITLCDYWSFEYRDCR